jgi:UDP-N-acetylmuramoylalanine--D-glutamate ligase
MKKKLVILGGSESGVGAALLGQKQGFYVFLSDAGPIKEKYISELQQSCISYEQNGHTPERILDADVIIKSPGIPEHMPLIQEIRKRKIPVWSEIEFAFQYTQSPILAITGTNGKTTVTHWAYHLFSKYFSHVIMAGNVGNSFAREVALSPSPEWYVLEISSFQLDDCYTFKPAIAVITNITPDHLDRYENSMEKYVASKFRIIQAQNKKDVFIYNKDDERIAGYLKRHSLVVTQKTFGFNNPACDAYYDENKKIIHIQNNPQNTITMMIEQLALQGRHNIYNALAVALSGKVAGISNEKIRESLMDFKGVEHRLELVMNKDGVDYINDSKATNVNSAWYALDSMTKPVVWICGGQDKGNDYSELDEVVKAKVKAIVCLGKDNSKIINHFRNIVPHIVEAQNMNDAVVLAYRLARKGDVVLLSPACASFDLFENYEDRGRRFKAAVRAL